MSRLTKFALLIAAVACVAVPAVALAGGPPTNPGTQNAAAHQPSANQPGPNASLPAKAKAYGRYCQTQNKSHVAGQQGTPFSQCVTAMAKLASGTTASPTKACSAMSKHHVAGEKGTPFSRCVAAGAKLLKDQQQQNP